jgi:hypothetical protein
MIIQTENPIRMVRELKGAPLSIIFALHLVTQRVTQEWLERTTGYTDKPVSQALQYLAEVGLVDQNGSGWQLVKENARQLPLMMQIEEVVSEKPEETQEREDPTDTAQIEETAQNQTDDIALSRNNSDSVNLSKLEVVNTNILINDSSHLTNLSGEVGKIPTSEEIRKVLDAAADLFGHEIIGDPRQYADIDRLLGWIAQAHHGGTKVKNPAGLVYWAFHKGKDRSPEKKFIKYPDEYLPESFIRASGQWEFEEG